MLQNDSKQSFQLIYSLGEHPYLGFLIEPHIVQLNANGSLSLSSKRVFSNTVEEFNVELGQKDREVIKLLDEIEQSHVIKRFYKKAIRPIDYFSKVYDEKTHAHVRPKIEQKLLKVLTLIKDKPFYKMSAKDGYPADQQLHIASAPTSILFHFRRSETETRYFPTLKYRDQRLEFMYKDAQVIINEQAWLLLDNMLYHFDQPLDGKKLSPFLNKRYISVARPTEKKYFETFVVSLIEKYHVYAEGFEIKTITEEAIPILMTNLSETGQAFFQLLFQYGDHTFSPAVDSKVSVKLHHAEDSDAYTFVRIRRSVVWENKQIDLLTQYGLQRDGSMHGEFIVQHPKTNSTFAVIEWVNEHKEILEEKGFRIQQQKYDKQFFIGKTSLDIKIEEENDWFDLKAIVYFGSFEVPFIQLRQHILTRQQEFELPNGEIAIIPEEWFSKYEHLFHFSNDKDSIKLTKAHYGLIRDISEHTQVSFGRKLETLTSFEQIDDILPPADFEGSLRPYQQAGYNWFHFLQKYKFGGILADDMGLGKTVQTLALLQRQKECLAKNDFPRVSLLVLPTSLAYNWQHEAKKFAPKLNVHLHTGAHRTKDIAKFDKYDLVITTYGIVRIDEDILSKYYFNYIILDESQNIKNSTSKSFQAIKTLKSRYKIALSGTPVENSVSDIWSQMHFTNPGLLGSYRFFQDEFVIPIEKKKDSEKAARLQSIIKPFVLRRTKSQVAKELPLKTEQMVYCDMHEEQSSMYEKIKSEYRNLLLDIGDSLKNKQFTLLQGLTKLRQLANHPKMIDDAYEEGSGKFDAAIDMLDSVYKEGNKVLIFSQFVKHLQIFKSYFDNNHIEYAYLDGATKDRETVVEKFKSDDHTKIFLISIKAGGVGLNLTEADYVFILDPWWNPAVEQQAIDRTHRIGQQKNVFIYRFISKDTVEEKIVNLQNHKRELANSLITTEETFVKSLSPQDFKVLFE